MRRKLIKSGFWLLALLALAAVTIQIVLWTSLPRALATEVLEQHSGLVVHAASVRTSWFGHTTARDVTFRLPLEDSPILHVPKLQLWHAGVIRLVFGRPLDLRKVKLEKPVLLLQKDDRGEWNVAQAVAAIHQAQEILARERPTPGVLVLPTLEVTDAIVQVVRRGSASVEYPLELTGEPDGALEWNFRALSKGLLTLHGSFVPCAPFRHRIDFELPDLHQILLAVAPKAPSLLRADGTWSGSFGELGLTGQLELRQSAVDQTQVSGTFAVTVGKDGVTASPHGVRVGTPHLPGQKAWLRHGTIAVAGGGLTVEKLEARTAGTSVSLSGHWEFASGAIGLDALWSGALRERDLRHQGQVHARATLSSTGPLRIEIDGELDAQVPEEALSMTVSGKVGGGSWSTLQGTVSFPSLAVTYESSVWRDDGLLVRGDLDWPKLRLTQMDLPGSASSHATAAIDLEELGWSLDFQAKDWQPPLLAQKADQISLVAKGEAERIGDASLHVRSGALDLTARGSLVPTNSDSPLTGTANLVWQHEPAGKYDMVGSANLRFKGRVLPLDLTFDGELRGQHVPVVDGEIDEVEVPWHGAVDLTKVTFESDPFTVLDGKARLTGEYVARDRLLEAHVTGEKLSAERALDLLGSPVRMKGLLATDVDLRIPELNPNQLTIDGSWEVDGGAEELVESASGRIHVDGKNIHLHGMSLHKEKGTVTGEASYDADRDVVHADFTSNRWPLAGIGPLPPVLVNGTATLDYDIGAKTADGTVKLTADVPARFGSGHVEVDGKVNGTVLSLERVHASVAGGTMDGSGRIPLDSWWKSDAHLKMNAVRLDEFPIDVQSPPEVEGALTGDLTVAPAQGVHQPGPLGIELKARVDQGKSRGVDLSGLDVLAYAGPDGFLIERGTVQLAGGTATLWARMSRHEGRRYGHSFLSFENLDLNQLVHLLNPSAESVPGRISGNGTVGGAFSAPHRFYGSATMHLTGSDLASVPVVSAIYDALKLKFGGKPTGHGTLQVQLEGDALRVSSFQYFNEGTEIAASMTVRNLGMGAKSPIDGIALGSVHPLRELGIPLTGSLDSLIAILQSEAVSYRISGTLLDRKISVVPFAQAGASLQNLVQAVLGYSKSSPSAQ